MNIDPGSVAYIVLQASKAAGATTAGLGAAVVAQETLPWPELAGNLTLIAFLAVLVGRYTFRQLEDYRQDLKHSRARSERLEDELDDAHHELLAAEARILELEAHAHRLTATLLAAGIPDVPPMPPTPSSSS